MQPEFVEDAILEKYKTVAAATVFSALKDREDFNCLLEDVYPMTPGKTIVGRARTLRFLPDRPDLAEELAQKQGAEYEAMDLCSEGDVLVVDALGIPYEGIGGDIKYLQLKIQGASGLITDGAIRDLDEVAAYGYPIFARRRTPGIARTTKPYQANVDIQCAGVLARPGDVIVGNDDGVVVVPSQWAKEVVEWAIEHEGVENEIKKRIEREKCSPGKYYNPKKIDEIHKELYGEHD